jgi:hypothetical protein
VEDVRQTLNVRRAANGSTAHTTNTGAGVVHDCGLGEGFDLGGDVGNRISHSNLVGLLGAGLELGLNLLRLLRTTSYEVTEELLDSTGLLDLVLEVGTEASISVSGLRALDSLGWKGTDLVVVINEVRDDVAEVGVVFHVLLFCVVVDLIVCSYYGLFLRNGQGLFSERSNGVNEDESEKDIHLGLGHVGMIADLEDDIRAIDEGC